jgi:hypothetical protein
LEQYDQKSPDNLKKALAKRFGLTAAQAAHLINTGKSLKADFDRIDEETKKEIAKRYKYKYAPVQSGRPANPGTSARRPAAHQKSVFELAREDGLYTEVEGKKQAALAAHFTALGLDAATLERITKYVQSSILPQIKQFTVDPRASGDRQPPKLPGQLPQSAR